MIVNPQQYEVNKMCPGDIIYVTKRPLWYRIYRKFFMQKETINVRTNWDPNNEEYKTYYREDCVLLFKYEMICTKTWDNIQEYFISNTKRSPQRRGVFKALTINLYNLQVVFKDDTTITIPLDRIKQGIRETEQLLKDIDRSELVESQIKFMRYKGDYFKELVHKNNIQSMNVTYCIYCGGVTKFVFLDEGIKIETHCSCGNNTIEARLMTYNEFAIWYASQTDSKFIDVINKQLFKQEGK